MSLDLIVRSFARDLRAEGCSARTVEIHTASIRYYRQWLATEGYPDTLDSVTRHHIRAWLASLTDAGRAAGTTRIRHASLRRLCGWLAAEGELPASPMAGVRPPLLRPTPVPVITDADLTALIRACAGTGWRDRRDEALIRTLLDTGVRAAELLGMTPTTLDLDTDSALVTGKGSRIRQVYFSPRTARAIERYLRLRRQHRQAHLDALWLSQRGRLSYQGLWEIIAARAAKAGVERPHPHQFRHTSAHDFLANGGQERDAMRLYGWTSPAMLSRYGASQADARAAAAARRMARGDRI